MSDNVQSQPQPQPEQQRDAPELSSKDRQK